MFGRAIISSGSDNRRDYVVGTINDNGLKQVVSMKETCAAYVVQHCHHRCPKTFDVQQDYRLTVLPKLGPSHDFHDFFDGADTTRKCHEGIRTLEHSELALVHGVCDRQVFEHLDRISRRFPVCEKSRNDRADLTAVIQCAASYRAHYTMGTAAVDQR
ncbi:hypothetical protein BJS_01461 [Bradyrhizobium japonicum SEMIA 5079]|nr:hypothetical protein BJS_01461 [Bradyrhizobium japonicum SEMIA 5079]